MRKIIIQSFLISQKTNYILINQNQHQIDYLRWIQA